MSKVGKSYKKTVELRRGLSSDVVDSSLITITDFGSTEDYTLDKINFQTAFINIKVETVTTTPFTITNEDIILVDPSENTIINLPLSSDRYDSSTLTVNPVTIKHIGETDSFSVRIIPLGTEELDRDTDALISRNTSLQLTPDGIDWWIV